MEFPHLGQNCSYSTCNQLDFLPIKCDACKKVFCRDHFSYTEHSCSAASIKDVQVPACPLCGVPVPGRRGELPDMAVGEHIDNQCTSDPARERQRKVFTNRCSYKGCKAKEMVQIECRECSENFCLKHRHTTDHACEGKLAAKRRQVANAAMARMKAAERAHRSTAITDVQGNMTEDEALAHALALSMQDAGSDLRDRDNNLARAMARVGGEQNSRCSIS